MLLAAAGFKAYALALGPASGPVVFSAPWMQVGVIEIETLLGLWLLGGWSPRSARIVAIGFFGLLASVSLYLALAGQRSCGCFGPVAINPWWTFAFDVVAVAAILLYRLPAASDVPPSRWLQGLVKTAAGALLFLTLIGGVFVAVVDRPADTLARLRGEPITVEPTVSQLGDGVAGERQTFTIELVNHGDQPVRVFGGTTTCRCISTVDLPVTIPPHESQPIRVEVKFSGEPGQFEHLFQLYTEEKSQPLVVPRFAGRVIKPPSHDDSSEAPSSPSR